MDKQISIIPTAGLCNRLRAIVSGINIARQLEAACTIYWNKTDDCCCRFADLFEQPSLENVRVVENNTLLHTLSSRKRWYLPTFMQILKYDSCIYYFSWNEGKSNIFDYIKPSAKKILLMSCFEMYRLEGLTNENNALIRPKDSLEGRVREITQQFAPHTIGIHIRGTDNNWAKTYSPTTLFEQYIDTILESHDDTKFYLATDEYDVKKQFVAKYGERIVTLPLVLSRSSQDGMEGALVDLYCLSHTNQIVGSDFSSFSEIAAMMGNIPLKVLSNYSNTGTAAPTLDKIYTIPFTNKTIYKRAIW